MAIPSSNKEHFAQSPSIKFWLVFFPIKCSALHAISQPLVDQFVKYFYWLNKKGETERTSPQEKINPKKSCRTNR